MSARILTNGTTNNLSPHLITQAEDDGESYVTFGDGYLFYSNNPEAVSSSYGLADSGYWLNRATVTGAGRIYTWHINSTGQTINSCLFIYNPNNFPITVEFKTFDTTNGNGVSDIDAWNTVLTGGSGNETIAIAAGAYQSHFLQTVPNNYNFGITAKTIVKDESENDAQAVFYDLAYISNISGATRFAPVDGEPTRVRGISSEGDYNRIYFNKIAPIDTNGIAYTIGANHDSFGGDDLVNITDPDGNASGNLLGSYGQKLRVTLQIKNTTGTDRSFRIYIGSNGGNSYPIAEMDDDIAKKEMVAVFNYTDVIDTGTIDAGDTENVTFYMAIPALSSTPYVIGARIKS